VSDDTATKLAAAMMVCEVGNGWSHLTLKNLRPPGSTKRGVPRSGLFELVSCANYTYEIGAFTCFCFLAQTLTGESCDNIFSRL
jgi:very-long-chain enoyl-CoA reductase